MDTWLEQLRDGHPEAAWDLFIERYRRLIFSAIRHYTTEHDDVMDVFADVCESLRADGMANLRAYTEAPSPSARFSTWLVVVIRNRTVDWFRHRDGRRRDSVPGDLSLLEQQVFRHVFIEGRSHAECFELLNLDAGRAVSKHDFAEAVRGAYSARRPAGAGLRRPVELTESILSVAPEERSVLDDASGRLARMLTTLDPADRLAIQLFVVDELSAADVARIVGWPGAKTVYNRVSRGLNALRRQLAAGGIEQGDL